MSQMNPKRFLYDIRNLSSITIHYRSLPLKKDSLNRYFYISTERKKEQLKIINLLRIENYYRSHCKRKIPGNIED